jgi:hypothetical protein
LNDGHITGNTAEWCGGIGVGSRGSFTMTGASLIADNSVSGNGGGICLANGLATLSNGQIRNNSARHGGGMYIEEGRAVLSGVQIVGNTAEENGGGLYIRQSITDTTLTNSMITHNQAYTLGNGLYIEDSSLVLLHTTIARNTGGDGSGLHVAGPDSTVALTNTILVSHTVGITVAAGSTATLEATLWGAGAWANLTDWDGAGTIHTSADRWGDPAFVDPDAGDHHILYSSAATDAGIQTSVVDDIDGDARPMCLLSDCQFDLGADEYFIWKVYLPLVLNDLRQGGAD